MRRGIAPDDRGRLHHGLRPALYGGLRLTPSARFASYSHFYNGGPLIRCSLLLVGRPRWLVFLRSRPVGRTCVASSAVAGLCRRASFRRLCGLSDQSTSRDRSTTTTVSRMFAAANARWSSGWAQGPGSGALSGTGIRSRKRSASFCCLCDGRIVSGQRFPALPRTAYKALRRRMVRIWPQWPSERRSLGRHVAQHPALSEYC